ncbi:MAG TPA: hypothetical protein VGK25_09485 [Ignavibacteria bacterium]|jgi:hypothetical protein
MEEQDILRPSTGASLAFAIGFLVVYAIILFAVLAIFFTIPF